MIGPVVELPDSVRHRVVGLAADALGTLAAEHVPATLRRVADFAPARRARLAATQIAAVLESDDEFRERVAAQVRGAVPDLATALDDGTTPPAADPVEVAAVAYLLRPEGWKDLVDNARTTGPQAVSPVHEETVDRLQRQLSETRGEVRATRDKARDKLATIKTENAELRRKLADTRQRLRDAESRAMESVEQREVQAAAATHLEAEIRRLRARVTELEASTSASKRAVRDEREQATIRSRLLLDTLLESVQGLRRELALPPTTGLPADVVEGVEPSTGTSGTTRARAVDDPALLEELFGLPRVHVVIDGYNVTKTAWETAPLDTQRTRLMNGLAPVVARCKFELTVVFDGADLAHPPPVAGPRGVRVMFSPPGVIADVTIAQLVAAEPAGRPLVVVSSDREVADNAVRAGARPVASAALVRLLTR
ncbi:MAG: NYN domain-containing protein [Nocardioidaceae bacterium]